MKTASHCHQFFCPSVQDSSVATISPWKMAPWSLPTWSVCNALKLSANGHLLLVLVGLLVGFVC